ncbi:MAG: tRNA lysidine(34) synthetase TilS [Candidatus Gracilibacteria bacterium]
MPRNKHKSPEEKTLLALKKYLKGGETIICAVSGGADSVFLLNCLLKFNETTPIKIVVMHINHSLRGPEADMDAEFVKNLAEKHSLTFHCTKVDVTALAESTKSSLEEIGREIRYKFGYELFEQYGAAYVVTAHHADDNLETILLNFIRGSGLKGLSGIKVIKQKRNGLKLFRPLLSISKDEIRKFLEEKHIHYKFDQTNLDTTIPRNFLRYEVIPKLKEFNPNLQKTILKNSQICAEIHEFLKEEAEKWIEKHNLSENPDSLTKFDLKSIRSLPLPIQKEILRRIYKRKTGDIKNVTSTHIDEVLNIINKNIGRKQKRLGEYTVEIQKGTFILRATSKVALC